MYIFQKTSEAALLGAAYRAKYCLYLNNQAPITNGIHSNGVISNGKPSVSVSKLRASHLNSAAYHEYVLRYLSNCLQRVCDPCEDSLNIYDPMLSRYREMVKVLVN